MLNRTVSIRRPSATRRSRHSSAFQIEKPKSLLPKLKYYYDKYHLRNYAPFILLLLYSLMGAYLFHMVEYDHEQMLIRQEHQKLQSIRNNTLANLRQIMSFNEVHEQTRLQKSRDVLVKFEEQIFKNKMRETLKWDLWGALFYVGTVFTTIGYGNITPRTVGGQTLSMFYALFGIPLVFAILSQFGKTLTTWVSAAWMRYNRWRKSTRKNKDRRESQAPKARKWSYASRDQIIIQMEKMEESQTTNQNETEDEDDESRTIPIWVALFLCLGYICTCAGLFCIWESKWSYFTSFYFIFISLSTIGLGDVIPDHPHMLILMFWLVIIGLSIVSMLLSVIQIKIEEWLYKLLVKMQRKYQQAVENGEIIESDQIFESLLENEPWFMRNMASHLITEKQAAQVEKQAETYERVTREMNTRAVQTEGNPADFIPVSPETQRSATMFTAADTFQQADTNQMVGQEFETANESALQAGRRQSRDVDSEWDIPSLPMDSKNSNSSEPERISQVIRDGIQELALLGRDQQTERHFEDQAIQVDAKFGDSLVDQSQNTSEAERRDKETATPQPPQLKDQLIGHSIETEDKSLMTSRSLLQPQDKETECDVQTRSIQIMFPDVDDDEFHQLNVDATEKRRRFSDSRLVTSFDKSSADGKQVQNKRLVYSVFSFDVAFISSAQYSIEDPKMMESTGVQCIEDLGLIESGAQYSIEDPKMMESKAIQCSNVFKMNETGCQYSTEEPKQFESIGIQCTNEFLGLVEFGVQCSPQMVNEEVSTKKDASLDMDDESTAGPRGTVYKAKVMRSSSTISLNSFELDQIKPIKEKLDIVLQTEDSYLRIARRLDEYRTIKTQNSLQVYATHPDTAAKQAQPLKQSLSNRESKTQYLLLNTAQPGYQWKRRRSSRTKNRRVSFQSFPDDENQKDTDDNEEKQSPEAESKPSEHVQTVQEDINEEKNTTPPRLSAIPSNILTDRPEIRVDSPARDTDPESVDGKQKSGAKKMKRVVKTRPKSKSETIEEQVPSPSKPTNPFERSNTDLNQLRIDDSHVIEAHQLGQPIQGRAQLHFVTAGVHLRKTSTPAELEVSRPVPGNVAPKAQQMESSSSHVQLASSQYAGFIDRKSSLPLTPDQYETSSAETSHKSSVSSTASTTKRRSSIFSLIRRDTNDSDK